MKGKEIVLCNFDDPTTQMFVDHFQEFFNEVEKEEEKEEQSEEVEDEEDAEVDSEEERAARKKRKSKCFSFKSLATAFNTSWLFRVGNLYYPQAYSPGFSSNSCCYRG